MELTKIQVGELTVNTPQLQALTIALGLTSPQYLLVRIQSVLPAKFEQQLYLTVAEDYALPPESFAKVLRAVVPNRTLIASDFLPKKVGKNLAITREKVVLDFLNSCMLILGKVFDDYSRVFSMNMEDAVLLVQAYGEQSEDILESMMTNVDRLRRSLKINSRSDRIVLQKAFKRLKRYLRRNSSNGDLQALHIWDIFPEPTTGPTRKTR